MKRIALVLVFSAVLLGCEKEQPVASAPARSQAAPAPAVQQPPPDPMRSGTEKLFHNPYDTDAVYLLSQKTGTPDALAVLIKRVSQNGVTYSRWLFDCEKHTAQNMGVAESIQALDLAANSMPSKTQPYTPETKIGAIAKEVCQ